MSETSALFLSMALDSIELPQSIVERLLIVPAIRRVNRDYRPPLNLDAPIFRYRVAVDGTVSVNNDPVGARNCRANHRPGRIAWPPPTRA
jgi:hypothetical protein